MKIVKAEPGVKPGEGAFEKGAVSDPSAAEILAQVNSDLDFYDSLDSQRSPQSIKLLGADPTVPPNATGVAARRLTDFLPTDPDATVVMDLVQLAGLLDQSKARDTPVTSRHSYNPLLAKMLGLPDIPSPPLLPFFSIGDARIPMAARMSSSALNVYGPRQVDADQLSLALGQEFAGMPGQYGFRPVAVLGGRSTWLEHAPRARLFERLDSSAAAQGSTAGVFRGEMMIDGSPREVAVKVYQDPQPHPVNGTVDWEPTFAYAGKELAHLRILADLGLGPRPFGMVRVGGNVAIAMERIQGKAIDEMTPDEVSRFVTEETFRQVGTMWQRLLDAGYEICDFQFAVLTEDQVVNGVSKKAGDVVFWDAGGLSRISDLQTEMAAVGATHTPPTAEQIVAKARIAQAAQRLR